MNYKKQLIQQLEVISHQELKEKIGMLAGPQSCSAHIELELEITSSQKLSIEQRQELLGLLFIRSLRCGVLSYQNLVSRIDSLIVPVAAREALTQIMEPLKGDHDYFVDQIRSMVYSVFAAPATDSEDLKHLAAWIRTHPALMPEERESLSNSAELRAIVHELAAEGESCAVSELAQSRNRWYIQAISESESLDQLDHIQKSILADSLPRVWKTGLNSLLEHAEESLERDGAVEVGQCITRMIQTAVLACRLNASMGPMPDYAGYIDQITHWFFGFINSPIVRDMLELEAEKARNDIGLIQQPSLKTRSLMVFSI